MKMTYHNRDMEDYIDYHNIRYILYITNNYMHAYVHMQTCTCSKIISANYVQKTWLAGTLFLHTTYTAVSTHCTYTIQIFTY